MDRFVNLLVVFAVLLVPAQLECVSAKAEFVHPGITHTQASIDFAKAKIAAEEQPWAKALTDVQASRYAELDWKPQPVAHVERGPYNNPNIGSSEFSAGGNAAYRHALLWALTGKEAHAKKSAEILNAWSSTLKSISNHDAKLLVGMEGYDYCNAAELIKHTWEGWPQDKQSQFEKMLRDVFYPTIKDFYPSANGNWDASMLQTMLAMGVFLDDQAMFDRAVEYYRNGKGNGAIGNYFKPSGQCQESGRDQGHTQMGLDFLACTCEIAWNQGVDLYGALDNRLLKGFEYTAKYNLGLEVPYEPYRSFEGRYHYKSISDDSRGRLRPMYEKVLNHYQNRKGLDAEFTRQAAMKLRDGSSSRRSSRRGRRRRGSALGTLMFAKQPDKLTANTDAGAAKVVCFGDSITNRGYYEILGKRLGVDAINAGVGGNTTAKGLRRISNDVLKKDPDVVVIFFGTNDLRVDSEKVFVPLDRYKVNLKSMVNQCRDADAKVVLCTLPPIDHDAFFTRHEREPFDKLGGLAKVIENYRQAASDVASNLSVPLVDLNRLLDKQPEWRSKDGVHPSEKGNAIIANHIATEVSRLLSPAAGP